MKKVSGKKLRENLQNVNWILRQAKGIRGYIGVFLLINLISMVVSLASTIVGKYVVDAATGYRTEFFTRYIIIMLATSVFSILFSVGASLFSSYASEKFAFGLRGKLFDRVQRSLWQEVSRFHSGDLLSRLTSDISAICSGILSITASLIVTCVQILIVLVILFRYDPYMALFGLIIGPAGLLAAVLYRKRYSRYQKELKQSESEYYSFFQEHLANLSVVKSFQLEDRNNEYFDGLRSRRLKLVMKSAGLSTAMSAIMRLIYSLGYVAAFTYCACRLSGAITFAHEAIPYTYGTMTLFLSLMSQLQSSIRSLGNFIPQFYGMLVSARRLRTITELEREDYTPGDGQPSQVGIRLEQVDFSYDTAPVLRDLDFRVRPGERIGVVGVSGAGKTTLVRLLLSLVQPQKGQISYFAPDGWQESACPASRRLISYVPQGNTLLSGTVRENLLLCRPEATDEQMWQALELADAADFLRRSARGLDTELSEKAGGLSEGQAQRIAIARALLRDRPVLIMDEATSALDEQTEARILARVSAHCKSTCVIITHRRSMLQYCDRILEIRPDGTGCLRDARPKEET